MQKIVGLFSGCLLASDIDGTLISDGVLPDRNVEKIEWFLSEGGAFSLASGRSPGAVSSVFHKLKRVSPSVMMNGCCIYDFDEKRVLSEKNIATSGKKMVGEVLDACKNIGIEVHIADKVFELRGNSETADHQKYEEIKAISVDYSEALGYNWNKVIYMLENEDDLKTLTKISEKYCDESDFVNTSAVIDGRARMYFEHMQKGVNKASGINELCQILNIEKGSCYVIGDYYNDVEMLAAADISAVPAEAPDDIKEKADVVVGSARNGAVADFIDYLALRRKEI